MAGEFVYFLVVIFLALLGSSSGEYCTERYHSPVYGTTTRTIHCSFGCCGSYYDQYCCVSSTGFIVGIVFAAIFTIAVISAIVCCCIKHKGARGRVVQPSVVTMPNHQTTHSHNVFIVPTGPTPPAYSTDPAHRYPPPPAYYQGDFTGPMPPAYGQASVPPPPYNPATPGAKSFPQQQANPFAAAASGSGTGH